jgi:UDP-GlcNAc:undecaprenyl-phosphate/decaprenyl-phosphate GlcNAc-1-phosphate transferase
MLNFNFLSNIILLGAIVSVVSFFSVLILTPRLIKILTIKGEVVQDYHKAERPRIPRPAGPVLAAGIGIAEIILYMFTSDLRIIAFLLTSMIAFIIGYIDDKRILPGWFKPSALVLAAIPLVVLGAHDNYLNLIFGTAYIPLLYIPLILISIPVVGNTINSIDVLNGAVSGFVVITSIPLLTSIAVFGDNVIFLSALPLFFVSLAFYRFHKNPSRIFPGDSGTLVLGAMYGSVAIAGNSEIVGVIALLPAVMNSFLFLSSVRRIVEHREVKSRPTILTEDYKLAASSEQSAPVTLLRLILTRGPLSENNIVHQIFMLAAFSSLLSFVSILIQYYFLEIH